MKKFSFLFLFVFLLSAADAFAANKYWYGATSTDFNTVSNWSTSNTSYVAAAAIPGSSDVANYGNYTGMTNVNCVLSANINVAGITSVSGYTGTITQGTYTITIGTSGASLSAGTFSGGSGSITCSGAFTISGCAFTNTSGTFSTSKNFTFSSGSYSHNNGKLTFTATNTITGSINLYKLSFAPTATATFTIASGTTLTVEDSLDFAGSASTTINTGNIYAKKHITILNTNNAGGGTATITINGTARQNFSGGTLGSTIRMPNIVINKSSDTLFLYNTIAVLGNWTYTAGGLNAGTSRLHFQSNKTITGSHTLNDIRFGAGGTTTISSGTTLTVNGTIDLANSAGAITVNTGTINAKGDIHLDNPTTGGGGTATFVINGTGNQSITGNTTGGTSALPNVTINKSSGTLTLSDIITVAGNWTYTAGTLSIGSSKISFSGSPTITGSHTLNKVTFVGGGTVTISGGTVLTVNDSLQIATAGASVIINTGTIYAKGTVDYSGNTFNTSGGGTGTIEINGTSDQHFYGSTTSGSGRVPNIVINKPSGTLYLHDQIVALSNWTFTTGTLDAGSSIVTFGNTKTISGTHTLHSVQFYASSTENYNLSPGTTLTVTDQLIIGGTGSCLINTGDIYAKGNILINNTGTGGGGSATITINGTSNQSLTGSGTATQGKLPNVVIDKSADTLNLISIISVANSWTYNQGTVNPGTSTVVFYGTLNVDGQASGSTSTMPFYNVTIGSGTATLTGNLNVDHNLTISSGTTTLSAGSNSIFVGGDWNSQGTWTYATSTVAFDGSGYQHITAASAPVNFYNFTSDKSSKSLSLLKAVKVNNAMTLTEGHIVTTSTNYLELIDNATLTGGNDSAYVDGPMRKTGNDAFTFPLGDTTLNDTAYHPLAMTAPSGTTDQFEAEYYAVNQTYGSTLVDTLERISSDEYWRLQKNAGSSNVTATISWNRNSSIVNDYDDLRVAAWDGSKWIDRGQGAMVIHSRSGTIAATLSLNFSSQSSWGITLAREQNTQPYAILQRKLDAGYYQVSNGKLMFRFDEEYNDPDAKLSFNIYTDSYTLLTSSSIAATAQPVYYGDNRYLLNILSCDIAPNGVLTSGYFILEVINDKNEHWYLRFKHTTTLTTDCSGGGSGE